MRFDRVFLLQTCRLDRQGLLMERTPDDPRPCFVELHCQTLRVAARPSAHVQSSSLACRCDQHCGVRNDCRMLGAVRHRALGKSEEGMAEGSARAAQRYSVAGLYSSHSLRARKSSATCNSKEGLRPDRQCGVAPRQHPSFPRRRESSRLKARDPRDSGFPPARE